jgi:hypothetical protein
MVAGVIALSCVAAAQPAPAQVQSHGPMTSSMIGVSTGRGVQHPESPAFERREEMREHRRFSERNHFRHRFFNSFGFGGFGFPYYPYYTDNYPGYYPTLAAPPEGPSAYAAPPPVQVGDLPPCRETTDEGVVVFRGTACTRTKH